MISIESSPSASQVLTSTDDIVVVPSVLHRTLMFLATAPLSDPLSLNRDRSRAGIDEATERNLRQATLEQLLESLPGRAYAGLKTDLLVTLERSQFYKVLVWLHNKDRDFSKAIDCYLKDETLMPSVFGYIREVMSRNDVSLGERDRVKDKVISRMHDMINFASEDTAELISEVFMNEHGRVVRQLEAYPHLQYKYLHGIIDRANNARAKGVVRNTRYRTFPPYILAGHRSIQD
jgi:hypothetical protein